jgi:hypothetical protein
MGRNRVIYQSEALYVSKNIDSSTGVGEHYQLTRVQSANYNFDITRQDVNQFGQLARIDALVLQSPTVSLDFSYYPTDGSNEKALGFYVRGVTEYVYSGTGVGGGLAATCIATTSANNVQPATVPTTGWGFSGKRFSSEANFASGQMGASSGQNFYIVTADEGSDVNTLSAYDGYELSGKSVIAIGNGFLSNYTFNAAVGQLPTASVTIEGLNMSSSSVIGTLVTGTNLTGTGNYVSSPTINPEQGTVKGYTGKLPDPIEATGGAYISALRPGDITLGFSSYEGGTSSPISKLSGDGAINVQNASLTLPLSRTPIERLGSRFAFARVVDFPIVATLNVSAVVSNSTAKNLASMLDDNTKRTITLTVNKPDGSGTKALEFSFKGSQLKSESFSSSIGANKTVDLVFETQVGGPSDVNNGIYLSGVHEFGVNDLNNWGF